VAGIHGDGGDGGKDGRKQKSDETDRNRDLDDGMPLGILNDDVANVALVEQILDRLQEFVGGDFDLFGNCSFGHGLDSRL
jgi:hypothetical protein